ncbi:hypothetical protein INT43_004432 [Umbelopsis isabellina]|uniref:DUF803-domain-containing protein n=1 Tax=Mortierella isabellina TaxID=91625 RepID=A0A8H7PIY7_MORIS|nr:hypothetical protein INT43_004432 [Umbelopsis isabellina]
MSSNSTTSPFTGGVDTSGSMYKIIGVSLAIASGVFIGSSFVFKKKGLLSSIEKSGGTAGEGHSYLKSPMWWTGMILSKFAGSGEILLKINQGAVLSSIFLKERLTFQGKVGCFQCIVGATVIVLHAPQQSTSDTGIDAFQKQFLSVAFLVYFGLSILISLVLVFWAGPRWGKKNMLIYISVCSLIGSISVVCTQGLGAAIIHSITIENEFNRPFLYILMAIVVVTLLTEINYLNKALNLFNTALVTPTYYVIFTTLTIVSSAVLYGGFQASGTDIATVVMGFLIICSGVALLHNSKSQPTQTAVVDTEGNVLEIIEDEKYLDEEDEEDEAEQGAHTYRFNPKHSKTAPPGHYDPGPADLFPAPFIGIQRYATTTVRNRKLTTKSTQEDNQERLKRHITRRYTTKVSSSPSAATHDVDFAHTISMGNTNSGEDGIGRERRWLQPFPNRRSTSGGDEKDESIPLDKFEGALSKFAITRHQLTDTPAITSPDSLISIDEPTHTIGHRDQEKVGPFTSHKMKLSKDSDGDRQGLISRQSSDDEDTAYDYAADYLGDDEPSDYHLSSRKL